MKPNCLCGQEGNPGLVNEAESQVQWGEWGQPEEEGLAVHIYGDSSDRQQGGGLICTKRDASPRCGISLLTAAAPSLPAAAVGGKAALFIA